MAHQLELTNVTVQSTMDYQSSDIYSLYQQVFSHHTADNFFLSFEWISAWLEQLDSKPELITFFNAEHPVGFALLGCRTGFFGKTYFLNQTGRQDDDQVWIEYNNIISKNAHKQCRNALLDYLYASSGTFKLVLCNLAEDTWQTQQWRIWSKQKIFGYMASLTPGKLSSHYSKNTKSQLSRANKYIERHYGAIELQVVEHIHASAALEDIAQLHRKKWQNHPLGSGFNNPKFVAFHKALINKHLNNTVFILKFTAGDLRLGYLYYFVENQRVYFYLSAIDYADNHNNFKPGMLMHTLAMQHFANKGYTEYDFLAGEARYKTSLSNMQYSFNTMHLFRNKWYYLPIKTLVECKRWIKRLIAKR